MIKINKFTNFKRLDFKNISIVLRYYIKRLLKIKPNRREHAFYIFYNYLIESGGYLFEETDHHYVIDFKNNFAKRIKLRKKPSSDIDVFQQVYILKEYLPVVNAYKNNFKNNDRLNIIDAGGNIGLTSLFFLENFDKPNIVCLEPEMGNFENLEFNLIGTYRNEIVLINGALWSSNCKIKVINDFRDQLDWSFRVEETKEEDAIEAFSINYLVRENGFEYIDILKIDIEGSEKQIFNPELSNLDFLKITKCIAVEIHDEFNCRQDIYTILTSYGFEYFDHEELTIGINKTL